MRWVPTARSAPHPGPALRVVEQVAQCRREGLGIPGRDDVGAQPRLADDLGDPFLDLLIGPYTLDADKGLRAAHKIPADLPLLNEWGTPIPVDAE